MSLLRTGYMLQVLKKIHPQKASMLSAESFRNKVMQLQNKEIRRAAFANRENNSSVMDSSDNNQMESHQGKVIKATDDLLINVAEFVDKIKDALVTEGQRWVNRVIKIYGEH